MLPFSARHAPTTRPDVPGADDADLQVEPPSAGAPRRSCERAADSSTLPAAAIIRQPHELRPRPAPLALPAHGRRGLRPGPGRAAARASPRTTASTSSRPRSRSATRPRAWPPNVDPGGPPPAGAGPELRLEPPGLAAARPPGRAPPRPRPLAAPPHRARQAGPARGDAPRPVLPEAPRDDARRRSAATTCRSCATTCGAPTASSASPSTPPREARRLLDVPDGEDRGHPQRRRPGLPRDPSRTTRSSAVLAPPRLPRGAILYVGSDEKRKNLRQPRHGLHGPRAQRRRLPPARPGRARAPTGRRAAPISGPQIRGHRLPGDARRSAPSWPPRRCWCCPRSRRASACPWPRPWPRACPWSARAARPSRRSRAAPRCSWTRWTQRLDRGRHRAAARRPGARRGAAPRAASSAAGASTGTTPPPADPGLLPEGPWALGRSSSAIDARELAGAPDRDRALPAQPAAPLAATARRPARRATSTAPRPHDPVLDHPRIASRALGRRPRAGPRAGRSGCCPRPRARTASTSSSRPAYSCPLAPRRPARHRGPRPVVLLLAPGLRLRATPCAGASSSASSLARLAPRPRLLRLHAPRDRLAASPTPPSRVRARAPRARRRPARRPRPRRGPRAPRRRGPARCSRVGAILNRRCLPDAAAGRGAASRAATRRSSSTSWARTARTRGSTSTRIGRAPGPRRPRPPLRLRRATPALADRYAAADVAVFLSEYEGFGLPALEAAARGVPLVVEPAARRSARSSREAALLVDPRDADRGRGRPRPRARATPACAPGSWRAGRALAARHSWADTARADPRRPRARPPGA